MHKIGWGWVLLASFFLLFQIVRVQGFVLRTDISYEDIDQELARPFLPPGKTAEMEDRQMAAKLEEDLDPEMSPDQSLETNRLVLGTKSSEAEGVEVAGDDGEDNGVYEYRGRSDLPGKSLPRLG